MHNPLIITWFWPALIGLTVASCLALGGAVVYHAIRDNKQLERACKP